MPYWDALIRYDARAAYLFHSQYAAHLERFPYALRSQWALSNAYWQIPCPLGNYPAEGLDKVVHWDEVSETQCVECHDETQHDAGQRAEQLRFDSDETIEVSAQHVGSGSSIDKQETRAVYCEQCRIWLNGPKQWSPDHVNGKRHRKNLQKDRPTHATAAVKKTDAWRWLEKGRLEKKKE